MDGRALLLLSGPDNGRMSEWSWVERRMVVFGLMLCDCTILMAHHRSIHYWVKFIINHLLRKCARHLTKVLVERVFMSCFIESMLPIILLILPKENLVNSVDSKLISFASLIGFEMRFSSVPMEKRWRQHHEIRQ